MNRSRDLVDIQVYKEKRSGWSPRSSKEDNFQWKNNDHSSFKYTESPSSLEKEKAIKDILTGSAEKAFSQEREGEGMTNHFEDYIKESIKNLREEFKEKEKRYYDESLKINMQFKEREERIINDAVEREKRYQEEMKKLREEAIERENRARDEVKEREERLIKIVEKNSDDLAEQFKEVKTSMQASEQHIQSLVTANATANKWGIITTIIAIIAIVVSFYLAVNSIGQSINDKQFEEINEKIEKVNINPSKTE